MKRILAFLELSLFYGKEIILSNFRIAHDVLTPTLHMNPKMVEIELEPDLTDIQLTALANLITMTPGTLSIDITQDRKKLLIHAMYVDDAETLENVIKDDYERRISNVF